MSSPFTRVDRSQVEQAAKVEAKKRRATADLLACSLPSGPGYHAPQAKKPTEEIGAPPPVFAALVVDDERREVTLSRQRAAIDHRRRHRHRSTRERNALARAATLERLKGLVLRAITLGPCDIHTIQLRVYTLDRGVRVQKCREAAQALVGEGKAAVEKRQAGTGGVDTFSLAVKP